MLKLGNACCALATGRNQPATFLLGCHHVFLDSEDDPGLKPGPVSFISFNGNRIGGVALAGQMNPGSPPAEDSDDAALATIQPAAAATLASYWRLWQPGDLARNFLPIALDGNYALYADGAFLPAKFIGWAPGFLVPVGNGQTIRIPEALLYDANSAPGVSGAAFLDRDNNIILGMHMARMQSKDTPVPWVAVAQPLWRLLAADGPFAQDLYLGRLPNPT
jgi:hypothetical protein